jgi:hypothetical protein
MCGSTLLSVARPPAPGSATALYFAFVHFPALPESTGWFAASGTHIVVDVSAHAFPTDIKNAISDTTSATPTLVAFNPFTSTTSVLRGEPHASPRA